MKLWAVDLEGTNDYFAATLCIQTSDDGTEQTASDLAAQQIVNVRIVRAIGPMSFFYDDPRITNVRRLCV